MAWVVLVPSSVEMSWTISSNTEAGDSAVVWNEEADSNRWKTSLMCAAPTNKPTKSASRSEWLLS